MIIHSKKLNIRKIGQTCILFSLSIIALVLFLYYSDLIFSVEISKPDTIGDWIHSSSMGTNLFIIFVFILSIGTALLTKAKGYGVYLSTIALVTATTIFVPLLVLLLPDTKGPVDNC